MGLMNAAMAMPLAVVAFAIGRYSRRPALAHILWVVVLLKLLTPPLVQVPIGWQLDLTLVSQQPTVDAAAILENNSSIQRAIEPPLKARGTADLIPGGFRDETDGRLPSNASIANEIAVPAHPWVVHTSLAARLRSSGLTFLRSFPALWLTGAVTTLVLLACRAWGFHRFLAAAGETDSAFSRRLVELARRTGLKSAPRLVVVHGTISPMLWGAGPATQLLFPARLARELSPSACDALLLHELAHFSRGDQWVRVLELAARVLFWWHPVVWWACREIEASEEQCCDAWVVERQSGTPRSYAEALLATIDFLSGQPLALPPVASGLGDVPLLRIRLMQIMRGETTAGLSPKVRLSVVIAALCLLPTAPALFGASVRPMPAASTTTASAPLLSDDNATPAVKSPASSLSQTSDSSASTAAAQSRPPVKLDLPIEFRPAAIVTASAFSPDGNYRLERRKGADVTLASQTSDFRLNMANHQVLCAAFAPDSRSFITGHADSQVRVWDSQTGGQTLALKGSSAAIWSISVTANETGGLWVAAGAQDGSVLIWDLVSGDEVARLSPSVAAVSCLRWSHGGDQLAISFGDFSDHDHAALFVWSPHSNAASFEAMLDKPVAALAWLPGDKDLVTADWAGEAQVWRLEDDSPPYRISLGTNAKQVVEAAHWSPDCPLLSAWLASGSP
jgi:beta-lactamase regulating signal transducer with metallopeptidase domain